MDINIRVAGEAGQGVASAGDLLAQSLAMMGLHVLATQSYMSRIRGGLNWYDVRISDRELFAGREKADLLVALTDEALETLRETVALGGAILSESSKADGTIHIDFTQAAVEAGGAKMMANTVATGAVYALLGYEVEDLCRQLSEVFKNKSGDILAQNVACARKGFELTRAYRGKVKGPAPVGAPGALYSGAESIALAASSGGVKFYIAYPMSPSTATLNFMAKASDRYGIVVEQAEDEIAAVNMACGAAYAGVPAMTGTSGGGFALMVEGLSLAGITELPIVIMVAQRPGPATGLPTRTAQGELKFAISAGHGEFARAIYAPGSPQQCYDLTRLALETAHKYQTPAIILTDQFLQDLQKNIPPLDDTPRPINRCIVTDAGEDYARYAVTESGISPRAIPGGPAKVLVDSDEHDESGHITEDLGIHLAQHDKRMRKLQGMTAEAIGPELYGPDSAEMLLVCWGSTYMPCREAVDSLNASGESAAMLHFAQVWPINVATAGQKLGRRRRVICVEGNATGQLASVLRETGIIGEVELLLRYDGMPFTAEYIVERIKS
ncbi:MAG: 2-oxoacid:acceptor oxidoreductase subunit alpha [Planctomycetes bacterium]|nr:2-oxoacid:acceptor oxidoreductase subunit alpha [Planctomycetota bacterium]